MDPLSITTSVLALANAVFKATVFIRDTVGDYSDAPQTMIDVADEVKTMEVALRVVKRVIRAEPHAIARFDLEDVFSLAVKGCHATLMCIMKEYEQLFGREDWRAKVIVLWKDREMTDLLARLDRKKATIGILVQTLNLHSTQEIKTCLNNNRQTLHVAKRDLCDLLPAYPSCKASILGSLDGGTVDGILGDQNSVLSTTEFAFDYEVINTKAYRGALARLQINGRTGSPSSGPSQMTTSVSCPEVSNHTVSRVSATEPKNRLGSSYDALPSQALLSATPTMRPRKQPCPQDPIAERFASLALEQQGPPRNWRSPGDAKDGQAPSPSTDATQRSPQGAQHPYETDAVRVDKTVACVLIETKRLLETLTKWSHGQATEDQVSQVFVKQGDNFRGAARISHHQHRHFGFGQCLQSLATSA